MPILAPPLLSILFIVCKSVLIINTAGVGAKQQSLNTAGVGIKQQSLNHSIQLK